MAVTPYTQKSTPSMAGLVTDGNALVTAEQSNLDESNYEMLRDATRRRRRPIVEETLGADLLDGSNATLLDTNYLWETPANVNGLSIAVVVTGGRMAFYAVNHRDPVPLTTAVNQLDILDLATFDIRFLNDTATTTVEPLEASDARVTFTEGNGNLYCFSEQYGTLKITYTPDTDTLSGSQIRVAKVGTYVRDYTLAEEEFDQNARPTPAEVTEAHLYNLSNTGWDAANVQEFSAQSVTLVTRTISNGGFGTFEVPVGEVVLPSLMDKYLNGRRINPTTGNDEFSIEQLVKAKESTSQPPTGARISSTDLSPAGTLSPVPSIYDAVTSDFTVTTVSADTVDVTITFPTPTGRTAAQLIENGYVAVNNIQLRVVRFGRLTRPCHSGMAKIVNAVVTGADENTRETVTFRVKVNAPGITFLTVDNMSIHSMPVGFPGGLLDAEGGFDYTNKRRSAGGTYFQGRLWKTADAHNRIYFSQVLENRPTDALEFSSVPEAFCFQAADPTDGDDNTSVATDGGYIAIDNTGRHYGMEVLNDSVLLFAEKGIYAIRPGDGGIFSPTTFRVSKVMDTRVMGKRAWASTGEDVHVATEEGIVRIFLDSSSFGNTTVAVDRLMENRNRSSYDDLIGNDRDVVGQYDSDTRNVRWLFTVNSNITFADQEASLGEDNVMYTYSLVHSAWYKYIVPSARGVITDFLVLPRQVRIASYNRFRYLTVSQAPVFPLQFQRWDWSAEVLWDDTGEAPLVPGFIAEDRFADFINPGNTSRSPTPAFMLTNHTLPGQGMQWSQILYIIVHNRNVTDAWVEEADGSFRPNVDGGTLLSIRWDWMDRQSTGKWADPYQTYRFRRSFLPTGTTLAYDRGEPVLVHKMKLRGRGREYRLYFESDGHKDSHIEGWAHQGYVLNGV